MNALLKFACILTGIMVIAVSSGCMNLNDYREQRVPKSALTNGQKTIYFTDGQYFPATVLSKSLEKPVTVSSNGATTKAMSPDVIAAVVGEILKLVPESLEVYKAMLTNMGSVNREFFASGYEGEAELNGIRNIVKEINIMPSRSVLNPK